MHIGSLTIELHIPGCRSLKHKRGQLKPLLAQLNRRFNLSAAEIDRNDAHSVAIIACVLVANDGKHVDRVLSRIPSWIESTYPNLLIVDHELLRI